MLGIRVKYLAKHDGDAAPPAPDAPPVPPASSTAAPRSRPAVVSAPSAAAAPVTDWVVAAIPSDADAPPADAPEAPTAVGQFAVDDEPEEAAEQARSQIATIAAPREGDVLPAQDLQPSIDLDQDEIDEVDADADVPVPPVVAPPLPRAAARPTSAGPQRYGEAVVRQVLDARFVREEPYEPPTRFS